MGSVFAGGQTAQPSSIPTWLKPRSLREVPAGLPLIGRDVSIRPFAALSSTSSVMYHPYWFQLLHVSGGVIAIPLLPASASLNSRLSRLSARSSIACAPLLQGFGSLLLRGWQHPPGRALDSSRTGVDHNVSRHGRRRILIFIGCALWPVR